MHVHVICADGEAKYWLEPGIELAKNFHLSQSQLNKIMQLVEEHLNGLKNAWEKHFAG